MLPVGQINRSGLLKRSFTLGKKKKVSVYLEKVCTEAEKAHVALSETHSFQLL